MKNAAKPAKNIEKQDSEARFAPADVAPSPRNHTPLRSKAAAVSPRSPPASQDLLGPTKHFDQPILLGFTWFYLRLGPKKALFRSNGSETGPILA